MNYMTRREQIVEFLIANQPFIKQELDELKAMKEMYLRTQHDVFRLDLEAQFDTRIRQWIAFKVGDSLGIPAEDTIIQLEKIDLEAYLDV